MIVPNFEIIITKPFLAALILSPFRFYGDIYKLVYTTSLCGATAASRAESLLISIETIAHRVWFTNEHVSRIQINYKTV